MSRTIITVTCVGLLTSTLLLAGSENPFARWEQVRTETENSLQQSSELKPAGQKPIATASGSATQQVFFNGRQTPAKESLTVENPVFQQERLETVSPPPRPSGVVHASAVMQEDTPTIQQVGAEFYELFDEPVSGTTTAGNQSSSTLQNDDNPFTEFLAQEQPQDAGGEVFDLDPPAMDSASPSVAMPQDFTRQDVMSSNVVTAADFGLEDFGGPVVTQSDVNPFETAPPTTPPAVSSITPVSYRPEPTDGAQQSRVTVEWVRREEFNVGQPSQCELLVRNDGGHPVRSIEVEIVLPEGIQVTQAVPAPTATSTSATWAYQQLAAGEEKTIQLTVIPQQAGDVRMDAFVRTTAATASMVSVKQPLLAIDVAGPESVELGQQVHYTVTVKNPGTGRVDNVMIQAAIPEGLQHRQGGLLNIDVGTLTPGEQRQARLSLTGTQGGSRQLSVRAIGDHGLKQTATTNIEIAEPKLRIGVRGPLVQMAGADGDYELVVVNEGQAESNNVRARYQLPEGCTFVSASAGGHFNAQDSTIEWFLGTLTPHAAKQFKVTLKATTTGELAHKVGVISEQGKISTAVHRTQVKGNAKLELQIAGGGSSAKAGEELVYKIQINNVGQAAASNVGLSFEVPPGIDLVEVTGPSEYIADNGVVIFRSLPEVQNGESVGFTVRARCTRPGEHKVRARVASQSIKKAIIAEDTTTAR